MLTYHELSKKPKEFLCATSLSVAEFEQLLPGFDAAYREIYPDVQTREGQARQRKAGGGSKGHLAAIADKLLFILVYEKTYPLQTMHGLQFGLSQPQTNAWLHRLLPILQDALRQLGHAPERDARQVAVSPLVLESAPELVIDGTERRRQRPKDATQQAAHYSGKKKAHTDKNLVLVNAQSGKVIYLGPTVSGKTHDKKAADELQIAYPANATLGKDTGFQGYEPEGVLTHQPQKSREGES